MADSRYIRAGLEVNISHAIEEAGEFLAAAGKTQRWGLYNYNPELPVNERETNVTWLRREMADLRAALDRVEHELDKREGIHNG